MDNNNKKILIIEDEPAELFVLKKMLNEAGFQVLTANDGQIGLESIKKYLPDLVLLDIILPKINGFDILGLAKKDPEIMNIPIVVLTNLSDEESAYKSKTLGAVDYLVKTKIYSHNIVKKIKHILKI